jgi:hypothetical protein
MNTRLRVWTILAGAAVAATSIFGGAANADEGNLLINGDIFPNTEGWREVGHADLESMFIGRAGHLSQTSLSVGEHDAWATQCVAIDDTRQFQLAGETRVLPNQERGGHGGYKLVFFPGKTCVGVSVEVLHSQPLPTANSWKETNHVFARTKPEAAGSVSVGLVVTKHATDDEALKGERFTMAFRDLRLVGWDHVAPTGPQDVCFDDCGPDLPPDLPPAACIGLGCPGEEPEKPDVPDGPHAACFGCDGEPDLPLPVPPVDQPAAQPEPDFPLPAGDEPSDGPSNNTDDEPSAPDGPTGDHEPGNNNGLPSNDGDKPAPQAQPTLEPQDPPLPANSDGTPMLVPTKDTTINAATPTPPPPATGGDNPHDPAGDLSDGETDSTEVARSADGDSLPMPLLGGGITGLLALLGLGIVLKRAARSQG